MTRTELVKTFEQMAIEDPIARPFCERVIDALYANDIEELEYLDSLLVNAPRMH